MNEIAFSILDGGAELLVASLVFSLTLWFIGRIALGLYFSLGNRK